MTRCLDVALGALLAVSLAGGCVTAKILIGRQLDTDLVERRLTIGQSTTADVLALLGEPRGKGRAYLPIDNGPRTLWAYVYSEGNIESNQFKDLRRTELWIYFEGDRYDGYLWFSSFPKR